VKRGIDVRMKTLLRRLLGVERTVIVAVLWVGSGLVVRVRPDAWWSRKPCCGVCGTKSPRYDRGDGVRWWRALDLGTTQVFLEGEAPRVQCETHGVVVAAVPWARHKARMTRRFEDTVAWLATQCSKSAVCELMRIGWRTVGRMIERVVHEAEEGGDGLDGLRRIGIDEVSHRKGHRYLTVVVDHSTGRLVWVAPGRDSATVRAFLDALGAERCAQLEVVTADAAPWIRGPVTDRCPQARLCMDPFHVVSWATKALDEVRRAVWNEARRQGEHALAKELKGARFALWKNPEKLTERQTAKLAQIQDTNKPLYRAYLLKEQLRQVFQLSLVPAMSLLEKWLSWARRCRLAPFVKLSKSITRRRKEILAALRMRASNGRVESLNTRMRLIMRRAFGFHSPGALIALAKLCLGGLCPPLPGRLRHSG